MGYPRGSRSTLLKHPTPAFFQARWIPDTRTRGGPCPLWSQTCAQSATFARKAALGTPRDQWPPYQGPPQSQARSAFAVIVAVVFLSATTSTQPWWGTGAFTLAGGVAGAAITQVLTMVNDRKKAKREEDKDRRTEAQSATVRFLSEVHAAFIHMRDNLVPYEPGDVHQAWAALQVSADPEVVLSGRDYLSALNTLAIHLKNHPEAPDELRDNYDHARLDFMSRARLGRGLAPVPPFTNIVRYTDTPGGPHPD